MIDRDIQILLRPHPNEDIRPYKLLKEKLGKNFDVDYDVDYTNFLNNVSLILSPTSTALNEPYMSKIPIVSLSGIFGTTNNVEHHQLFNKMFSLISYNPKNIDEIIQLCSQPILEPKRVAEVDENWIVCILITIKKILLNS